ncbi:MAG TPA: CusA/CzcA family heavy metal efflux RND transporter [Myxococcota bacterium]
MLRAILSLCVDRRLATLAAVLAVGAYGISAYLGTSIEAFPDVTNYQVNVIAQFPGLAPEEIEKQITMPLERQLNGTPGSIQMRSESLFGLSLIFITFDDDVDVFKARNMVEERMHSAELPDGTEIDLAPDYTPLGEIYQFVVTSDRHDLTELRSQLEWNISKVMRQVPGCADVVTFGGNLKELHVEVDAQRLLAYGLTLSDVSDALSKSNKSVGGGFMKVGDQELVVRGIGPLTGAADLEAVVLKSKGGTAITVGDVARVVQSRQPSRGSVGYDHALNAVEGFALLRRGENPSDVLAGIHEKVEELNNKILPDGMKVVPFYDRTDLVDHTLHTVRENLLHGFILICAVVFLFLRSWRASAVVAAVIPLSLLGAFIGLSFIHLPANLISMGAIDFGIIVDGAIVLIENVMHHAHQHPPKDKAGMRAIVLASALEVAKPTLYAMAIIIAALIPVFSLQRVEGRIFRPVAMTYSFALVAALLLTFTLVPALAAILMKPADAQRAEPRFVVVLRDRYGHTLARCLRKPGRVLAAALVVLLGAGVQVAFLGREFLPQLDEGDLVIFVEMPTSIALTSGGDVLLEVRKRLMVFPEVTHVLSEQGHPEDGTDDEQSNMSETFVRLKPREEWRPGVDEDALLDEMRKSLEEIPGVRYNFSQPIKDNVEEAVSGVRGQVVLKIFGEDLDAMRDTLTKAVKSLGKVDGVVDLELYRDTTVPQLHVKIDRKKLARAGIPMADAQDVLETALAGKVVANMYEGERVVPIRVRLEKTSDDDMDAVGALQIPTASGGRLPLADLASIEVAQGRSTINHEANSRFLALKFNVEGRDMGSVIKDAMAVIDREVKPPAGHYFVWTGEFENQKRAMARLQVIVPIALIVVLALLYSSLGRARTALAILGTAPLSLSGGAFLLALAHIPLSVSAAVGFIALLGQVSLMGLLVMSALDIELARGTPLLDAIVNAGRTRFRAVSMAALLAILGLLPMAVSSGVGAETQRGFACVIVGGLVTTLITTMFVLPVVMFLVNALLGTAQKPEHTSAAPLE